MNANALNVADEVRGRYTTLPNAESFSAPASVARQNNISRDRAARILSRVEAYTLHRQFRKQKRKNPYFIYYLRQSTQVDLLDMQKLADRNDGYNFILICIDCFSRRVWARKLLSKHARRTVPAMKSILDEMGRQMQPDQIFADSGSEIKNNQMRRLLRSRDILLVHPNSEVKAGMVERVIRTMRGILSKDMTDRETFRWVDNLPLVVQRYNNAIHRSLDGLTPNQAELDVNKNRVVSALRGHYFKSMEPANKKPKFAINDIVRVFGNYGNRFARGHEEQFSRELYKVATVYRRMPVVMYDLREVDGGDLVLGRFYESELQLSSDEELRLHVLSRRIRRGVPQLLVRFRGFREPEWIREDEITADFRTNPNPNPNLQQQRLAAQPQPVAAGRRVRLRAPPATVANNNQN